MLREMRKILKIAGGGWCFALLILLRSPVQMAMTFVNANFLRQAFNAIAENNQGYLRTACIVFAVSSLCAFLYNGTVWSACAAPTVTAMEGRLRAQVFRKISSLSYARMEALPQGAWLTRLNADVQMPFSESWPHAAIAIVSICASSLILWRMNPAVYGWILLFVIPHILFSHFLIARAMPGLTQKSLEKTGENTDKLTALIACADAAALYGGQEYLTKRFEVSSMELLRANMKIRARNALGAGILPLFGLSGYLAVLIVSSGWIADGRFAFGDLNAAFSYRGGVLLGALMLMNCMVSIQASMAGVRRLNEVMAEKTQEQFLG